MPVQALVQKAGECRYWGLSTDTKPDPSTSNGHGFWESDTNRGYICDGVGWNLVTNPDYEPADADIQTHIGSAHAPSNAQANADITKAEIEAMNGQGANVVVGYAE